MLIANIVSKFMLANNFNSKNMAQLFYEDEIIGEGQKRLKGF